MKNTTKNKIKQRRNSVEDKRKLLFALCDGKCPICGKQMQNDNPKDKTTYMTLDHIIPKSKGGTKVVDNMRPMCRKCNVCRGVKDLRYSYNM